MLRGKTERLMPGRGIIGTYGGFVGWYIGNYFTGAVKNEKNNWNGASPLRGRFSLVVFPESGFLGNLVRFFIAYLLNTVVSVAVVY